MGSDSLDVILIGKDDDSPGVAGLHQTLDDLVKLSGHCFTGDLHRLSNANTTWTAAVRSDQVTKSNLVKAGQTRSNRNNPDQVKPSQTRSNQIRAGQTWSAQEKSGQIIQNQTRPDQVRQYQTKSLSNSK